MATSAPQRPATSDLPTRQQLDELDELLQRMLALPVNGLDDDLDAVENSTSRSKPSQASPWSDGIGPIAGSADVPAPPAKPDFIKAIPPTPAESIQPPPVRRPQVEPSQSIKLPGNVVISAPVLSMTQQMAPSHAEEDLEAAPPPASPSAFAPSAAPWEVGMAASSPELPVSPSPHEAMLLDKAKSSPTYVPFAELNRPNSPIRVVDRAAPPKPIERPIVNSPGESSVFRNGYPVFPSGRPLSELELEQKPADLPPSLVPEHRVDSVVESAPEETPAEDTVLAAPQAAWQPTGGAHILRPLIWCNDVFDRCTLHLGGLGRWLRGNQGRNMLGWTGILCLGAGAALLLLDWIHWTW